jgi:pilus assembly protein Flp/PilA
MPTTDHPTVPHRARRDIITQRFLGEHHMFETFRAALRRVVRDEKGVTAVEYAVIGALIIVVAVGSIGLVGTDVNSAFSKIASAMPN